jgi:hypothetical protein
MGYSAQSRRQFDMAEKALRESLRLRKQAGATVFTPFALITLANFLAASDRSANEIRGLYAEAAAMAEGSGSRRAAFQAYLALAQFPGDARQRRETCRKSPGCGPGVRRPGRCQNEEFLKK